jgi:hypothetical protein
MTPLVVIARTKVRAAYLDLFKTVLAVGMIFAHTIQLVDGTPGPLEHLASFYINLITFSGFIFAFGVGIGLSGPLAGTAMSCCKTPIVLFVAYCVSSFAFVAFIGGSSIRNRTIIDVVLMRHLYGYSEFLASFFLLSLVTSFLRPLMFYVCDNAYLILASVSVSFGLGMLNPSPPEIPVIGALIGSHDYATFPLAQYLPWFLIGVRYSREKVRIGCTIWATAIGATLAFASYTMFYGETPTRFPPDPLWFAGPAFFLLIYLTVTHTITELITVPSWILLPGRHVLFFLVTTNVILFITVFLFGKLSIGVSGVGAYTFALIFVTGAVKYLRDSLASRFTNSPLIDRD